jgi:hypothetical protein
MAIEKYARNHPRYSMSSKLKENQQKLLESRVFVAHDKFRNHSMVEQSEIISALGHGCETHVLQSVIIGYL